MKEDSKIFSECAAKDNSAFLCKRFQLESPDPNDPLARSAFEHDRDRIIHSRAFRRLMHKTQIFNSKTNDHIRNRLTHTMEVYQIARAIGKSLGLNDVLIEAIALGHDLGHTPFGHVGERTLNNILMGCSKRIPQSFCPGIKEGFKHNFQGLAVLDYLETGKPNCKGLNITLAVREGILKHTKCTMPLGDTGEKTAVVYSNLNLTSIKTSEPSFTLEGQVVAIADEIAQCTHDLEDAYRQRVIEKADLKKMDIVQLMLKRHPQINLDKCSNTNDIRMNLLYYMINDLIQDVYEASVKNREQLKIYPTFEDEDTCIKESIIQFSSEMQDMTQKLSKIKRDKILMSRDVAIEDSKAEYIIEQIFKAYYEHPMQLPTYILERYCAQYGFEKSNLNERELKNSPSFVRLICDHIGSMTDQHAEREYMTLYTPSYR